MGKSQKNLPTMYEMMFRPVCRVNIQSSPAPHERKHKHKQRQRHRAKQYRGIAHEALHLLTEGAVANQRGGQTQRHHRVCAHQSNLI